MREFDITNNNSKNKDKETSHFIRHKYKKLQRAERNEELTITALNILKLDGRFQT